MSDVGSLGSLKDCYVTQPNGKRALAVNSGGSPLDVISQSFELAVSMGKFPGFSILDKFGETPLVEVGTPADIWEGQRIYTYDANGTAPIISISSSGADIQPIKITGLDIDGNEVTQTITLAGTVRQALTTPLWRVYRMENEGVLDLVGTVYCYIGTTPPTAVTGATVRALIDNGNNQTLMAIYTIPKGKVGFLFRGEVGVLLDANPANQQDFMRGYYQSRRFEKVFKVKKVLSTMTAGDSNYKDKRSFPDPVPALTDIKLTITAVGADMGAWGTLDFLIVDEDKFSDEYLAKIGQPGY